uniref:uncharacterized protein YuxK n=1 Tax=Erigeron canadensis TaxID=72917 RepID=UPI001CB89FE3|nr:uncharacterized protein YuxK [Erigeron canadensis]
MMSRFFRSRFPAAKTLISSRFFSSPPPKIVRSCGGLAAESLAPATAMKPDKFRSGGAAVDLAIDDDDDLDDEFAPVTGAKLGAAPTLLQPRVVIFDGVCHLCHRGVKFVIKADKDKKIKFCCLQSKAAEPYMRICGADREDVLRRFLFIEGPYEYHQGSTAALKVLSYLPFPYSALSTLMIVPAPIRDAIYDYIAKRRYDWFGKDTNCLVLKEKELLERFVDRDEMVRKKWSDE